MDELDKLVAEYGLSAVIIILIIGVPAIVNLISWCKGIWEKREAFKQKNIEEGKLIELHAEQKEARFTRGEERMKQLEADVTDLKKIAERQAELIELLIKSDELDIKSWIKMQHEKWIPLGYIDSQTLDILEQRFDIYEKEGGNSWAEKLVKELRALPAVTVTPIVGSPYYKNAKR